MRCPFCSCMETRVVDSRLTAEGDQTRRRRECGACKERFTSYETAELNLPRIVKSDGRREPFMEAKLRGGIDLATHKRPVSAEAVDDAIARIQHKLRALGEREVDSMTVGDWVMRELRDLDQVAYVRFASVYRDFNDVRAFLDEIENLQNELPPGLKKDQLNLLAEEKEDERKA